MFILRMIIICNIAHNLNLLTIIVSLFFIKLKNKLFYDHSFDHQTGVDSYMTMDADIAIDGDFLKNFC